MAATATSGGPGADGAKSLGNCWGCNGGAGRGQGAGVGGISVPDYLAVGLSGLIGGKTIVGGIARRMGGGGNRQKNCGIAGAHRGFIRTAIGAGDGGRADRMFPENRVIRVTRMELPHRFHGAWILAMACDDIRRSFMK